MSLPAIYDALVNRNQTSKLVVLVLVIRLMYALHLLETSEKGVKVVVLTGWAVKDRRRILLQWTQRLDFDGGSDLGGRLHRQYAPYSGIFYLFDLFVNRIPIFFTRDR